MINYTECACILTELWYNRGQVNNSEVGIYALSVHWMGSRHETKNPAADASIPGCIWYGRDLRYIFRTRCCNYEWFVTSHNVEGILFMDSSGCQADSRDCSLLTGIRRYRLWTAHSSVICPVRFRSPNAPGCRVHIMEVFYYAQK